MQLVSKTFLANALNTFLNNVTTFFNNGARRFSRNSSDCIISDSCVFNNLILADKLFPTALHNFEN